MRFDVPGVLLAIVARNGSSQLLTYSTGLTNDTTVSRYPADAPTCSTVQDGETIAAMKLLCVTDSWGRQLQFKYDIKGRITQAIDPANQSYFYEYDGASGGCVIADPLSPACNADNLTKVIYPDGTSRTYFYNEATRINNGTACVSAFKAVGNGFGSLYTALTGLVDENGARHISWTYSCDGRATSSELANGVDKVQLAYFTYSTGDSDTTVTRYIGDPAVPFESVQHYLSLPVRGVVKNTSISAQCAHCGNIKTRVYDANGNAKTEVDFNSRWTYLDYDLARNLLLVRTNPLGEKTTFAWHATYRLPIQIAEPLRITSYVLDGGGNVLSRTEQATSDVKGTSGFSAALVGTPRTTKYTYNALGQVLTVTGPRTDVADVTTYTYDVSGNHATSKNALGHVTSFSNYDGNGRVGRIEAPNGMTITLTYNLRGLIASRVVIAGAVSEATAYEYYSGGQLRKVTMPDLSSIAYTYDDAHRLIGLVDTLGNSITYTLDLVGNRTSEKITDAGGALTRTVASVYDNLSRLQQQTGGIQ